MGFPDTAPGQKMSTFYNLVHAVGNNAPNLPNDVKLVQYLLKSLFIKIPNHESSQDIQIDGTCNSVTMRWILKFQIEASYAHPGKILIDNRIDRIREKNFVGSISHTTYSLFVLNASVLKYNPEAFISLPNLIPLENAANVPPPSSDIIRNYQKETQFAIKKVSWAINFTTYPSVGQAIRAVIPAIKKTTGNSDKK